MRISRMALLAVTFYSLPLQLLVTTAAIGETDSSLCENTRYSLSPGWNLISFDHDPAETPQELLENIPAVLSLWSFEGGKWYSLHQGQPYIDVNPIVDIEPGRGYWLRVSDSTTFQLAPSDQVWSGEYGVLAKGWNLLGIGQIQPPEQMLTQLGSDAIWGWNEQHWTSYLSGVPVWLNSLPTLQCGKGYYLFSKLGNNRPEAVAANFELDEDSELVGVLQGHDQDASDTVLTFKQVVAPLHGSLTLDASGSFLYKPEADYYGGDEFVFVVSDGSHSSMPAAVSLAVLPKPDPLLAQSLTLAVDANGTVGGLLPGDPDGGSVTYQITVQPARGAVSIEPSGLLFYTPNRGESGGQDQFTYRISAGDRTASATVTVQLGSSDSHWDTMIWDQDNWE